MRKMVKEPKKQELEKVLSLTQAELNEYVYYFDMKTVTKLFDWTGAKPLLNHRGVVVGVIADGAKIVDDLIVYEEGIRAYKLKC